MSLVELEHRDETAIIRMARPKSNALNRSLVHDLTEAFDGLSDDENCRAVVLTSACEGFFSVGFDVREVFGYTRDEMRDFWFQFSNLYRRIHHFPKPVVAALPGHTFAGGIILAFACDVRVMLSGRFGLGVSGINLGIPLPETVMRLATLAVGPHHARHLFLTGETITPKRAHRIGLVRSVLATPDELEREALRWADELGGKAPQAYRRIRSLFHELAGGIDAEASEAEVERFLDHWFAPEAEEHKARVRAKVMT